MATGGGFGIKGALYSDRRRGALPVAAGVGCGAALGNITVVVVVDIVDHLTFPH